jgi:hypothetical protein
MQENEELVGSVTDWPGRQPNHQTQANSPSEALMEVLVQTEIMGENQDAPHRIYGITASLLNLLPSGFSQYH